MKQLLQKSFFMALTSLFVLAQPVFAGMGGNGGNGGNDGNDGIGNRGPKGSGVRGTDSYRIYLNGKMLLQQYVGQPLKLGSLALGPANSNDNLVVYYNHCGATGRSRSITVKDENGNVLKEWKFRDAAVKNEMNIPAEDDGMTIPVKDILELQAKHSGMTLNYSARQLPAGRMLTKIG
jgi:hypothetical protein